MTKIAKNLNNYKGLSCEIIACLILLLKGYKILKHNFKNKNTAQVDIICIKDNRIHIIEVKFRKKQENCMFAISKSQQKRLLLSATNIHKKYKKETQIDAFFFFLEFPFFNHKKNIL